VHRFIFTGFKWPPRCRAAEKRDEIAPSHIPLRENFIDASTLAPCEGGRVEKDSQSAQDAATQCPLQVNRVAPLTSDFPDQRTLPNESVRSEKCRYCCKSRKLHRSKFGENLKRAEIDDSCRATKVADKFSVRR
jgi:hypothetical protein